jgi:hypothetical protein
VFDFSQMSWYGVIALAFVPTFILASLIRLKGVYGLLVIVGMAAIFFFIISDLQGWQLGLAAISALAGMTMGGNISDAKERKRLVEKQDENKRLREKRLNDR